MVAFNTTELSTSLQPTSPYEPHSCLLSVAKPNSHGHMSIIHELNAHGNMSIIHELNAHGHMSILAAQRVGDAAIHVYKLVLYCMLHEHGA